MSYSCKRPGLYRLYKILGWTAITFALILMLLRVITPLFTPKIPELSDWVARELKYPTLIQEIKLKWDGLNPAVSLYNIEILTPDKKTSALHIEKIKLQLSILQLMFGKLKVNEVTIKGAVGGIEYQEGGHLFVSKLPDLHFDLNENNAIEQVPLFKRLVVKDSTLTLTLPDHQDLTLNDTQLLIDVQSVVKIRAQTKIDGKEPATINLSADIPLIGKKKKLFFCHWQGGALDRLNEFFPNNPITIERGALELKAWLALNENNDFTLSTNLKMNDISIREKNNESLSFKNVNGSLNIARSNQDWIIESKHFEIETESLAFTLSSAFQENERTWDLKAHHIDLNKWQERFEKLNLLPNTFLNLSKEYQIAGQVEYVDIGAKISDGNLKLTNGDVVFTDVGVKASQKYPGVSSVSGAMTFDENKGKMVIQSKELELDYPRFYAKPLSMSNLALVVDWQQKPQEFVVKVNTAYVTFIDTLLTGEAKISFPQDRHTPEVELLLHLGESKTSSVLALLPQKVMDNDLTAWLDKAILAGDHLATHCVLRGNLGDFPFDNAEGVFEVNTELDHVDLDYKKGWPALTDLKANLFFRNRALFISAESGNVSQGHLSDADAVIPDLFAPLSELILDTKVSSTLEDGLKVVRNSPLSAAIKKTLAPLSFQGPMALSLGLEIPLSSKTTQEVKVRGLIEVEDASVSANDWDLPINNLKGKVTFTENSVMSDELNGIFLDGPTQFLIESKESNPEVKLTAKGNIKLAKIQKWFKLQELSQIQGETDYSAQLSISPDNTNQAALNITSTLQGITVDAPYPFAKTKEAINPLDFKLYFDPNQLIRIAGKYGDNVNIAFSMGMRDNLWQPVGGHIHFGEKRLAKFREDQVFLIDGDIAQVDFEKWKTFLGVAGFLSQKSDSSKQGHLEPLVELDIEDFTLYGMSFPKEKIEAQWDNSTHQWNLDFEGPALKGHAGIPQNNNQDIVLDLQRLVLEKTLGTSDFQMAKTPGEQKVDIKIKELTMGNKVITDIQARLEPSWKGYFFPNVKAKLKGTDIFFSGSWDYLSNQNKVSAEGTVTTKNITDTLSALGVKGTVQKAKGSIEFSLNWHGTPFKIDYPSLGGQVDLALTHGVIQGVNPGIGRVLSLLNLDNVKRRLNLDFSDVTKSGLTFNDLNGKFQFGKGKISSNKVTLNGPSAKIEAFGQADLENQGLNGEMIVMPDVTGSLPVAAAIASANPAVGAAVWVVDKLFGNKIQQIHRIRYKVLGTWASPKVEEVPIPAKG